MHFKSLPKSYKTHVISFCKTVYREWVTSYVKQIALFNIAIEFLHMLTYDFPYHTA